MLVFSFFCSETSRNSAALRHSFSKRPVTIFFFQSSDRLLHSSHTAILSVLRCDRSLLRLPHDLFHNRRRSRRGLPLPARQIFRRLLPTCGRIGVYFFRFFSNSEIQRPFTLAELLRRSGGNSRDKSPRLPDRIDGDRPRRNVRRCVASTVATDFAVVYCTHWSDFSTSSPT